MSAPNVAPMEVAERAARLREALGPAGCDALLVSRLVNIRYLTGFTGSAAALLVRTDGLFLVTDGRYRQQSAEELQAAGVDAEIAIAPTVDERGTALRAAASGVGRVGLEAHAVTWSEQRQLAGDVFSAAEVVPTEQLVEGLRRVKDVGEVARVAEAARIADEALARVLPMLHSGPAERDVAIALDLEMRRLGASGPSFETIVASGPNAAKPHARPSARRIEMGELVVLDFGAIFDGYCSDMTRTVCVGEPRSETARRMVDVVADSQRLGVAAVAPGADARAVDDACRRVITDAGWGDAFVHGTGHGVGLEIHESPRVSWASTDTLAVGHVVTVEPGVYLPGQGGVRIEDTVVVTEDGCRPLTHAPKELVLQ